MAFGSYGWGGQSVKLVEDILRDCKFEMMDSIKVQYIPDDKTLMEITEKVETMIE